MEAEARLAPAERTITMPSGVPEYTLGYECLAWMEENLRQPNGPRAGQPFTPTIGQARFILWFYAVDEQGRWLHNRGVRRLAKGSGKSPFAAAMALLELLGPVRVKQFEDDRNKWPGGVSGMPVSMPLVQIAATSERQTANTMRMVRAMANKRSPLCKKYNLDPGKTYIETPEGGKLEQITSSAGTAEGAEASFMIGDETEHWTPGNGGPDLMDTLIQNGAKTGARVLQTENAYQPGESSVAESTFDSWVQQQEGKTRSTQTILYDAVVAPANAVLHDTPAEGEMSLTEALRFVYADCVWVNEEKIDAMRNQIWNPAYPESRARRFFLNQPNAAEGAWVTLQEWTALADPDVEVQKRTDDNDGDEVVLFFDGSKSKDHTALIGCRVSDGHVFTLGVWEPAAGEIIDAESVDTTVNKAMKDYNVLAFYADVREWESYTKNLWPSRYKDQLILWAVRGGKLPQAIAWDMRNGTHNYMFGQATELCLSEIRDGEFTHDGDWRLSRHVGNCRIKESRGLEMVKKESPGSPNKIDAAVCMIGARMVRRLLLESDEYKDRNKKGGWAFL
ncbi:hypothetical protein [Glutamicibacter nicotianae]|uniref:hypothetical protein n=1 Tax=Glutamicibacter nicotianae TaxID=37929 RepID=UPI002556B824|nr:hypothetical protein [Glutamicibacter nicotianae]WIV44525.1 hypothetical protein QQS42_02585 [Glutamicibacter nicotianae]